MAFSFDELMPKGDTATASGKPREAIKLYKMAIKDLKSPEQTQRLHHKMFLAYLDRIKELDEKNMTLEAASLQKQAMEYMPDPASMDQAAEFGQKAMDAFHRQAFSEMFDHAKRAASLISTPESRRLLAGAAVLAGRYETAFIPMWNTFGL